MATRKSGEQGRVGLCARCCPARATAVLLTRGLRASAWSPIDPRAGRRPESGGGGAIDDGWTDQEHRRVGAFADDLFGGKASPYGTGGKAKALNYGLRHARGSVVVALDADTHFASKNSISKLVRWFADPEVGAVAGNAKVGNRINVITRWQALE